MTRTHNGCDYTICYNGEIYNTDELIPELSENGFVCSTTSDTEVILYAYIHWGADFVNRLNGIFAFAIWDAAKSRLLLYRDRVGVKPLFYAIRGDSLVFGSEPKACFAHPAVKPELDKHGLQELLAIGPAHTSGLSLFKDLFEVLPGHFMIYSKDGLHDETYWELTSSEHTESYQDTVAHTRFLVEDAIKGRWFPMCRYVLFCQAALIQAS